MLLKEILDNEIKEMFKIKVLNIKEKKIQIEKSKQKNFIKFMKQNHFIMIYVHIFFRTNCSNDLEKENAVLEIEN